MPLTLTNCVVTKSGADVLTNPTSAELYNDMTPSMYIIVTGGTVGQAPVLNSGGYKITGHTTVDRTFIGLVCKSAASPYKFQTPPREGSDDAAESGDSEDSAESAD